MQKKVVTPFFAFTTFVAKLLILVCKKVVKVVKVVNLS